MYRKLEEQSRCIESLEKTIHRQDNEMHRMKIWQNGMVSPSVLGEENAGDMRGKLETLDRSLREEIESLRNNIDATQRFDADKTQRQDVFAEVKSQEKFMENETKSLRKEINVLKARTASMESELARSLKQHNDISRKYVQTERNISILVSNQQGLKVSIESDQRQIENMKKELNEVNINMRRLGKNKNHSKKHTKQNSRIELDTALVTDEYLHPSSKQSASLMSDESLLDSFDCTETTVISPIPSENRTDFQRTSSPIIMNNEDNAIPSNYLVDSSPSREDENENEINDDADSASYRSDSPNNKDNSFEDNSPRSSVKDHQPSDLSCFEVDRPRSPMSTHFF